MNKFTSEKANVQLQDCNEPGANEPVQSEPLAITRLEPWQLELVGGGEFIVSW